jgi:hypothetical protein
MEKSKANKDTVGGLPISDQLVLPLKQETISIFATTLGNGLTLARNCEVCISRLKDTPADVEKRISTSCIGSMGRLAKDMAKETQRSAAALCGQQATAQATSSQETGRTQATNLANNKLGHDGSSGAQQQTVKGNFKANFQSCQNAKLCTQACANSAASTLQTQAGLPSLPACTASHGCPRRLSKTETTGNFSKIAVTRVRQLQADGVVTFNYEVAAAASQVGTITQAITRQGSSNLAAFTQALKDALSQPSVGLSSVANSMTVTSFSEPAFTPVHEVAAGPAILTLHFFVTVLVTCANFDPK